MPDPSSFEATSLAGARFKDVDLCDAAISDAKLGGMRIDGILATELLRSYRAR